MSLTKKTCENCGSVVYGELCVNCNELETIRRDFQEEVEEMDWGNTTRDDAGFSEPPHEEK